jgi:translocation and assembly module TamB
LPLRLDAVVERLHLENITFHPPEGEPRRLDTLTRRLAWEEGTLTVSDLEAAAEGYRAEGMAAAGFVSPLLRLDLRLSLPETIADMKGLRLTADLGEGDDALLSGSIKLRGGEGKTLILDLGAHIALSDESLRLRSFEGTHAAWEGVLRGEGEIALKAPFVFSLQAEAKGFDLARQTGIAVEIGGKINVSGTLQDYGGSFNLSSRGAGWRQGRLAGSFSGSMEGVALSGLDGVWLRGKLGGEATVGWHNGVQLKAMLNGRGLDPAVLDPQWSGQVNLDVEGSLAKLPGEALRADVEGELLDSTLRGRPLTGRADLSIQGEDLHIAAFELHGDGFDLAAHGRLRERLEVSADVRRLGGLIPGAAGILKAEGWLRWRKGEVAGRLNLQGERIGRMRSASVTAPNTKMPADTQKATV